MPATTHEGRACIILLMFAWLWVVGGVVATFALDPRYGTVFALVSVSTAIAALVLRLPPYRPPAPGSHR